MPIEVASSITSFSRSVAKIELKDVGCDTVFTATAFLVSKDVAITAAHVIGAENEWPGREFRLDFDFVVGADNAADKSFLEAVPFPWEDAAASEFHGVLANAYPETGSRLEILALAGVQRSLLLQEGTPHRTWKQALDVAASAGRTRRIAEVVLEDQTVAGYHAKIRALLKSDSRVLARPIPLMLPQIANLPRGLVSPGWGALRLAKPISRAPLPLGSAEHLQVEDGVIIIQHPSGGHKQFVLEPAGIVRVDEQVIRYRADTLGGSSGSPVFDRNMHVIAVHFFGDRQGNGGVRIDRVKSGLHKHGIDFVSVPDER